MRIIAGRWRGHPLVTPPGERTRPTTDRVREAWMSALQHDLPGSRVLDLFAGSGALGLEALSRGAAHVTFVELAAGPLRALQANVKKLGAGADVEIVKSDALRYVRDPARAAFDIAFADPPYDSGSATALVEAFRIAPFARLLCVEHRSSERLPGGEPVYQRRYGDTTLTFIAADHD